MAQAIFFEDLTEKAKKRIIEDELRDTMDRPYSYIEGIYVETDTYGYDPNPKKQTLEQRVHVRIANRHDGKYNVQQWLMEWNCLKHDFITIMKEDPEDDSFKEQMELHGIIVEYKDEQKTEGAIEATIHICVNAGYHDYWKRSKQQFTSQEDITVSKDISEKDLYELARKYYGKFAYNLSFIDRRLQNGCKYQDTARAIGERLPKVIECISKQEEYKYIVKED